MNEVEKVKISVRRYSTRYLANYFNVTDATVCAWKRVDKIPVKYAQIIIDLLTTNERADD